MDNKYPLSGAPLEDVWIELPSPAQALYSNNQRVQISNTEITIAFAQITNIQPGQAKENLIVGRIAMTHESARTLATLILDQIRQAEAALGPLQPPFANMARPGTGPLANPPKG